MLARNVRHQFGRRGDGIGDHQRQRAVVDVTVKQNHRQLLAQLMVVRVVEHAGGHNQPVHLTRHHVVHHHRLLPRVFIAAGNQQLHARLAAQRFQLVRKDGKTVVGDLRDHQTNGVAAVIAQRPGVNAGLIVVLFCNCQHALARLLRHAKLFAAAVQDQAGGGF